MDIKELIEKYNNPIERLIAYHTLLSGCDSYSLNELSDATSIPLPLIRNDFMQIFETGESFIQPEDDDIDETQNFISGIFDDCKFLSETPYDSDRNSDIICIPVTINEYVAFQNLFEQKIFPKRPESERSFISSTIRNKKYVNDYDPKVLKNLEDIEIAIAEESAIKFDYKAPGEHIVKSVSIIPTKIGFDATENRYVIISTPNNRIDTYELDCIKGSIKPASPEILTSHPEYLERADKVWGFEFDKCLNPNGKPAKPLHVKVSFSDHGNVINKVRRSLEFRTPDKLEIDKKGILIYEDDIYGKESFINWVLSFGSSAKIISPKSLAEEIVNICKKELLNYE